MIKKYKLTFLLVLLLGVSSSFGQLKYIGLVPFKTSDINNYAEAEAITGMVKQLFVESDMFTILDRSQYSQTAIFKEIEVQKNIEFIEGFVVEQGKQNGAQAIVVGNLSSLSYNKDKYGNFDCGFVFNITINDIETGTVIASKSFNNPTICLSCGGDTKTKAFSSALNTLTKKMRNFILETFPSIIEIDSIYEVKGGGEVLLVIGEENGVVKKDKFKIYEVITKNGRTRKVELATFPIDRIEGDFSVGKVKGKQFDVLHEKYMDDATKLECVTLPK